MPRPSNSARVASMSETIRYKPCAEPGAAAVTFLPKMIEHPRARRRELEHAGSLYRCRSRRRARHPELRVELLGAVDICDGDDVTISNFMSRLVRRWCRFHGLRSCS